MISDRELLALFSASIAIDEDESGNREAYIQVPLREVETGLIDGETGYQVGVFDTDSVAAPEDVTSTDPSSTGTSSGIEYTDPSWPKTEDTDPAEVERGENSTSGSADSSPSQPVSMGEQLELMIDTTGAEGDGIARISGGFIVFVSDAEEGEKVIAEVTSVENTYAFAEPVGTPTGAHSD